MAGVHTLRRACRRMKPASNKRSEGYKETTDDARAYQVRGEGNGRGGQWRLAGLLNRQSDQPEPVLHTEVVGQAAPEVVAEDQAAARLAARDRLALPDLRARSAAGDPRRATGRLDPAHREDRRDQGHDHRARRQDPDGQGLPDPRALRRRHGDRPAHSSSTSRSRSRAATSARTTTRSCTTTAAARSSTAAARC